MIRYLRVVLQETVCVRDALSGASPKSLASAPFCFSSRGALLCGNSIVFLKDCLPKSSFPYHESVVRSSAQWGQAMTDDFGSMRRCRDES
jgi:hypothetical protein